MGAVLALSVVPVAVVPTPSARADRRRYLEVGILAAVALQAGALLAQRWWLAVGGILLLGWAGGQLATRRASGVIALSLCLPVVAIGFSYPGWTPAIWLAGLFVVGSAYAWAVSLALPGSPPRNHPSGTDEVDLAAYGVTAGAVGAVCTAIGFGLELEHVGWVAGAALLVMRPSWDVQRRRSVGRIASVLVGALVAIACLELRPPTLVLAVLVLGAVTGAAATAASRWYVTPAFTTFLLFLMMVAGGDSASGRFWERLAETVLGVVIAYVVADVAPRFGRASAKGRRGARD